MREIDIFFKISNAQHRWFTHFVRSGNIKWNFSALRQNENNCVLWFQQWHLREVQIMVNLCTLLMLKIITKVKTPCMCMVYAKSGICTTSAWIMVAENRIGPLTLATHLKGFPWTVKMHSLNYVMFAMY